MSIKGAFAGVALAATLILPLAALAQTAPSMNTVVAQAMADSRAGAERNIPDPLANDLPGDAPAAAQAHRGPAIAPTVTVTNGPVPDTPDNRARYGKPMSHAGRVTHPSGD